MYILFIWANLCVCLFLLFLSELGLKGLEGFFIVGETLAVILTVYCKKLIAANILCILNFSLIPNTASAPVFSIISLAFN